MSYEIGESSTNRESADDYKSLLAKYHSDVGAFRMLMDAIVNHLGSRPKVFIDGTEYYIDPTGKKVEANE